MTEQMIRCECGLIVAESKMAYHLESEHFIKTTADISRGEKVNDNN